MSSGDEVALNLLHRLGFIPRNEGLLNVRLEMDPFSGFHWCSRQCQSEVKVLVQMQSTDSFQKISGCSHEGSYLTTKSPPK